MALLACCTPFPCNALVERVGRIWIEAFPSWGAELHGYEPAVFADYLSQRQIELSPPLHVGGIAKGAHHENAGAFFDACALIGKDRYRNTEKRCDGAFAEQRLVSLVVRMSNNGDTGRLIARAESSRRQTNRRLRRQSGYGGMLR